MPVTSRRAPRRCPPLRATLRLETKRPSCRRSADPLMQSRVRCRHGIEVIAADRVEQCLRRSPPLRSFRVAPRARTTLRAWHAGSNGLIHELRPRRATAIHGFSPAVDRLWTALLRRDTQDHHAVETGFVTRSHIREDLAGLERVFGADGRERDRERAAVPRRIAHDEDHPADPWVIGELEVRSSDRRIGCPDPAQLFDPDESLRCARDGSPRSSIATDRERHLGAPGERRVGCSRSRRPTRSRETPAARAISCCDRPSEILDARMSATSSRICRIDRRRARPAASSLVGIAQR